MPKPSTATLIPTYAYDGRRLRNYSAEAIERLLSLGLVAVERKRNRIVSAHFRSVAGANPLKQTAHLGQTYSVLTRVGDARLWQHTPLLQRLAKDEQDDAASADAFVRDVFRSVLTSVTTEAPTEAPAPTEKRSNVVSIAASHKFGRPARQPSRPIEFDSERRAA